MAPPGGAAFLAPSSAAASAPSLGLGGAALGAPAAAAIGAWPGAEGLGAFAEGAEPTGATTSPLAFVGAVAAATAGLVVTASSRRARKQRRASATASGVRLSAVAVSRSSIVSAAAAGVARRRGGGKAAETVVHLWETIGFPKGDAEKEAHWLARFAPNAVVEDLYSGTTPEGPGAGLRAYLANKASLDQFIIDDLSDGQNACGFTWHLEDKSMPGKTGLRGTTYIELNEAGRIVYLREVCESIFKPGDQMVDLLKVLGRDAVADFGDDNPPEGFMPSGASEVCKHIWGSLQGRASTEEMLQFFSDDCVVEDFNYEEPVKGKQELGEFLDKYIALKAVRFVPERYCDGKSACCFTWHVEIAGLPDFAPKFRGVSFYGLDNYGKISYSRDVSESIVKPPPLQALAARLRPTLRVMRPRSDGTIEDCECEEDGSVKEDEWPTGEVVKPSKVMDQLIVNSAGEPRTIAEEVGDAKGAVVVFLRHLGCPFCWAHAREWSDPAVLERLNDLGLAGPIMISVGEPDKLRRFLESNPTVPSDKIFVDDSRDYEAFKAMGFGMLGDRIPKDPASIRLRPPSFDVGSMFSYLRNVAWLSPIRPEIGVPTGVRLLGGTLVFSGEQMLFASADRVPGDYPSPHDVLDKVEKQLD